MNVLAALDWLFQLIANCISFLGTLELVAGLSMLHVLLAFALMGVVISVLVPRA